VAVAAFVVEAKQNSLKRQRTAEKSRLRNKAKKSEISTRMKKVHTRCTPPGAPWPRRGRQTRRRPLPGVGDSEPELHSRSWLAGCLPASCLARPPAGGEAPHPPHLLRRLQVFVALDKFKTELPKAESDLAPVSSLLSEAYKVIDVAVVKGVLHKNTAARRKARLASARQQVLIKAGLYTPVVQA
jgi:ribosomal protein S20